MIEIQTANSKTLSSIGLILKDLLKVIKVVSMYPEGNPLPASLKRTFSEKLVDLIEDFGEIAVTVNKDNLVYNGEVAYTDKSKEESLAGLFFTSGITTIRFGAELSVDDIYHFLDVLKTFVNATNKSLDLVALLWEMGSPNITFNTVEDVALSGYEGDLKVKETQRGGGGYSSGDSADKYNSIFTEGDILDDGSPNADEEIVFGDSIFIENGNFGIPQAKNQGMTTGQSPAPKQGQQPTASGSGLSQPTHSSAKKIGYSDSDSEQLEELGLKEASGNSSQPGISELFNFPAELPRDAVGSKSTSASGSSGPLSGRSVIETALLLNDELKLSQEEKEYVKTLTAHDADFDMNESTLELCKEMLHQETDMTGFYETVTIIEKVHGEFIENGRLTEAGQILEYFETLDAAVRAEKPMWAERLKEARAMAGSRERIRLLADSVNTHPNLGPADLRRYLQVFGKESLLGITELVGWITDRGYYAMLSDFLVKAGKEQIHIIAKGIFDKRPDVVINTITVLAQIEDPAAFNYLRKAASNENLAVRKELISRLKDSPVEESLAVLGMMVFDTSAAIRKEAIESIVLKQTPRSFTVINSLIMGDRLDTLDIEERQSVHNAFSKLGGAEAIDFFSEKILKYNFGFNKKLSFVRASAFESLRFNESERCEKLLLRLCSSWRPGIRKRAQETLRRRRETIFGGTK